MIKMILQNYKFNSTSEREKILQVDCYVISEINLLSYIKNATTIFNQAFSMRLSRFEEYLRKLFMEGAGATWPFFGMVSHVAVIGTHKTQDFWD
jgi:hypothetical protein